MRIEIYRDKNRVGLETEFSEGEFLAIMALLVVPSILGFIAIGLVLT